jgi:hypothetical protein
MQSNFATEFETVTVRDGCRRKKAGSENLPGSTNYASLSGVARVKKAIVNMAASVLTRMLKHKNCAFWYAWRFFALHRVVPIPEAGAETHKRDFGTRWRTDKEATGEWIIVWSLFRWSYCFDSAPQ